MQCPTEDIWIPVAPVQSVSANNLSTRNVRTEVAFNAGRINPHSRTSDRFKRERRGAAQIAEQATL